MDRASSPPWRATGLLSVCHLSLLAAVSSRRKPQMGRWHLFQKLLKSCSSDLRRLPRLRENIAQISPTRDICGSGYLWRRIPAGRTEDLEETQTRCQSTVEADAQLRTLLCFVPIRRPPPVRLPLTHHCAIFQKRQQFSFCTQAGVLGFQLFHELQHAAGEDRPPVVQRRADAC